MPTMKPSTNGLWAQLAIPFVAFVLLGTLCFAWFLVSIFQQESQAKFLSQAESNGSFIRDSGLPDSEKIAVQLQQILGVDVYFRRVDRRFIPELPLELAAYRRELIEPETFGEKVSLGDTHEAIATELEPGRYLLLVRPAKAAWHYLLRPASLMVLLAFLAAACGLGWIVARAVVRPLQSLARRLPEIGQDHVQAIPEASRQDEIGFLARSVLDTQQRLSDEREARLQAEKLSAVTTIAAGFAHEIQNPMAAIRMHLELLQSAPEQGLQERVGKTAPLLLRETEKVSGLLQQWMFLVRPEPPALAALNLTKLVQERVAFHEPKATHAQTRIDVQLPESVEVQADSRRITQVIDNLVLNAIQAMPGGGTLTIQHETNAKTTCLIFSDTGKGFDTKGLAQAGNLFFTTREGGMGIGLHISGQIAEAHGGRLRIGNRADAPPSKTQIDAAAGAEIRLEFPVSTSSKNS